MRTCHVAPFLAREQGGLPQAVRLLVDDGTVHGEIPHVVSTGRGRLSTTFHDWHDGQLTLRPANVRLPFSISPPLLGPLRRAIREADVVEIHGLFAFPCLLAIVLARSHRKPVVLRPHSQLMDGDLQKHRYLKRLILALLKQSIGQCVLAFASEVERRESSAVPLRASAVTGLPLYLEGLDVVSNTPPSKPKRVLALGRVAPGKGLERLLQSVALLDGDIRVDLVGGVDLATSLELTQQAAELGISSLINVHGFVPRNELGCFLRSAWALVVPSDFESFSLAAAEALAIGLPVCVMPTVGLADIAADSGGGIVASSLSANHLAEALEQILDPSTNLRLRGALRDPRRRRELLTRLNSPAAHELRRLTAEGPPCLV